MRMYVIFMKIFFAMILSMNAVASVKPMSRREMEDLEKEKVREAYSAHIEKGEPKARSAAPKIGDSGEKALPAGAVKINHHLIFSQHRDAVAWARSMQKRKAEELGAEKYEVLDDHPDQKVIENYVDELWSGFTGLFPELTAGMDRPQIVMVDTEQSNASVIGEDDWTAHVVIVLTGLIEEAGGIQQKDELTGILAHEIAHSVFLHTLKGVQKRIEHFYFKEAGRMGFQTVRNSKLEALMARYLLAANISGELTTGELLDFPSPGYVQPRMYHVWNQLRLSAACPKEKEVMKNWGTQFTFSTLDFRWIPQAGLRESSAKLLAEQKSCYEGSKKSLLELFSTAMNLSPRVIEKDADFINLRATYQEGSNSLEGIFKIVRRFRNEMLDIEKAIDLQKVGFYSTEQHADDVSALVHSYLKRDPRAFGKFLNIMMENIDEKDRKSCDAILKDGSVPSLGSFFLPHHTYCYRVHNFNEFAKKLEGGEVSERSLAPQIQVQE